MFFFSTSIGNMFNVVAFYNRGGGNYSMGKIIAMANYILYG